MSDVAAALGLNSLAGDEAGNSGGDYVPFNLDAILADDDVKGKKKNGLSNAERDTVKDIEKEVTKTVNKRSTEEIAKCQALLIKVNRLLGSPRFAEYLQSNSFPKD